MSRRLASRFVLESAEVLTKGQLFHDEVNQEILDQAWLWSYAGTSDARSIDNTSELLFMVGKEWERFLV